MNQGSWAGELTRRFDAMCRGLTNNLDTAIGVRILNARATSDDSSALMIGCAVLQVLSQELLSQSEYINKRLPAQSGSPFMLLVRRESPWMAVLRDRGRGLSRSPEYWDNDLADMLGLDLIPVFVEDYEVEPVVSVAGPAISQRLERLGADPRVGLASPLASCSPDLHWDDNEATEKFGTPFRFVAVRGSAERDVAQRISQLVDEARELKVQVLLLPELTLDQDALKLFQELLKRGNANLNPVLTIAGSTHVWDDEAQVWRNRCVMVDWRGRPVQQHDKLLRFCITAAEAQALSDSFDHQQDESGASPSFRHGGEGISLGSQLPILVTPLGHMATPICLDFIGDRAHKVFRDTRTSVLWVPAMSTSMEPFERRCREEGRRGCSVFIVNSLWLTKLMGKEPQATVSIAYLPGRKTSRSWSAEQHDGSPSGLVVFNICQLIDTDS